MTQAWKATIRILVPSVDPYGTPVDCVQAAQDYIAETLRGEFLDWSYVQCPDDKGVFQPPFPLPVTITEPYEEGSFS